MNNNEEKLVNYEYKTTFSHKIMKLNLFKM